jgi:hypothetical protein
VGEIGMAVAAKRLDLLAIELFDDVHERNPF